MKLLSGQPVSAGRVRAGDSPEDSYARRRQAASPEQALFRLDLMRSLQMHRRLAVGIALGGLAFAVLYLFSLWPVYTAAALVYVQPAPPRVIDQGAPARWPFDSNTYESFIQQQMLSVDRPEVLIAALKKLEPGVFQGKGESDEAAAERLKKSIETTRLGTSYQMSIAAHAPNAALAAKLANAVAASYIESASREARAGDAERMAMLREERDRVQRELAIDRTEQQGLNQQLGVASVANVTPDPYDDDIGRAREELMKARTAHDEAAARLTSMGAGRTHPSAAMDAEAEELIAGDAGLISLKTTLNQRRATLASQMANLTPNNPQYKQDVQEQGQIDASLEGMTKELRGKAAVRIQQRLRNDLERTAGVESQWNAQLAQMAAAAGGATPKMQRASDLAADIVRLQNRYTLVDDQWRNMMLEDGAPGAAYLSSTAAPPLHTFKSGVVRNAMMIAFAGLLFAVMAAVAAHKMDHRIYIASDVEQVLGFAPMAVLPDFVEVSEDAAEEHILRLSAGIEYAHQQGNLKSCIFTGAGPGAGVTTVATRVRSILETMGKSAVLVDASGALPTQYGSSGALGASDPSNGHGGQRGSRSSALLQQMAEEGETEEPTLVLTDTAPLAVSAETEYLARFVDAAIVVVESGVTTRAQLRDVANTLQRLDVAAVGFVLNRVVLDKADPAFRQSVRAIEEHLSAQSRSFARSTERSRPNGAADSYDHEQESRQPAAPTPPEAAGPQPEAEAAAHPAAPVVHELPASEPEEQFFPAHGSRTASLGEALLRERAPASAWPTRHLARPGEPEAQPAEASHAAASHAAAAAPVEKEPAAAPEPPPTKQPEPIAAAEESPAPKAFTPAPETFAQGPPAQSWDRVSSAATEKVHEQITKWAQEGADRPEPAETPAEIEDAPANAGSRLGGLRSLLFSLGLKNMSRAREYEVRYPEPEPPREEVERPPHFRTFTPQSDTPVRREAPAASPTLVTAPPEFLPPKPRKDAAQKEHSWESPATARRDRADPYDEVEILPSWRGQYKKKK